MAEKLDSQQQQQSDFSGGMMGEGLEGASEIGRSAPPVKFALETKETQLTDEEYNLLKKSVLADDSHKLPFSVESLLAMPAYGDFGKYLMRKQVENASRQGSEPNKWAIGKLNRNTNLLSKEGKISEHLRKEDLLVILHRTTSHGGAYRVIKVKKPIEDGVSTTVYFYGDVESSAVEIIRGSVRPEPLGQFNGEKERSYSYAAYYPGSKLARLYGPAEVVTMDNQKFKLHAQAYAEDCHILVQDKVSGMEGYHFARMNNCFHDVTFTVHKDHFKLLGERDANPRGMQDFHPNSFGVVMEHATSLVAMNSWTLLEDVPKNTSVFIEKELEGGWLLVRLPNGSRGRMVKTQVHGNPPMPGAQLHEIAQGDTVEGLFKKWYAEHQSHPGIQASDQAKDPRFFANVLMYINNAENKQEGSSVYKSGGGFDLLALVSDYHLVQLRANHLMWLPDPGYYLGLIGKISPGSIHGNVFHSIRNTLDQFWPVGFGVLLDGSLGATFGVPIGIDGELGMEIIRTSANELQVRRRYSAWAGGDTGVSAGAFVGNGRSAGTNKKGQDQQWGAGASAGANARLGARLYGLQEFSFPFEDKAVMSALLAVTWGSTSHMFGGLYFLGALKNYIPDPSEYKTKDKVQAGLEGNAEVGASVGLRAGTVNYASNSVKGRDDEHHDGNYGDKRSATTRPGSFFKDRWVPMLQLAVAGRYDLSASAGYETEVDPQNPKRLRAKWSFEFVSAAQVPFFLAPFFLLFPQASVAQTSFWTIDQSDPNAKWQEEGNSFKFFTGQLDYHVGNASEMELHFKNGQNFVDVIKGFVDRLKGKNLKFSKILDLVADANYTHRVMLPIQVGGGHFSNLLLLKGLERQLPREFKSKGFELVGYFTVKMKFNPSVVTEELERLYARYQSIHGDQAGGKLFADLQGWLLRGEKNGVAASGAEIARGIDILDAQARIEATAGISAGVAVSLGGKGRLQGAVRGGVVHESDITQIAQDAWRDNWQTFQADMMKGGN